MSNYKVRRLEFPNLKVDIKNIYTDLGYVQKGEDLSFIEMAYDVYMTGIDKIRNASGFIVDLCSDFSIGDQGEPFSIEGVDTFSSDDGNIVSFLMISDGDDLDSYTLDSDKDLKDLLRNKEKADDYERKMYSLVSFMMSVSFEYGEVKGIARIYTEEGSNLLKHWEILCDMVENKIKSSYIKKCVPNSVKFIMTDSSEIV